MAAGRLVLLCFYGTAQDIAGAAALGQLQKLQAEGRAAFGVSNDPAPAGTLPHRCFADPDFAIARQYGAAPAEGAPRVATLRRAWFVLDERLRILAILPVSPDDAALRHVLSTLSDKQAKPALPPPVLIVPYVFEPDFCARLIAAFKANPTEESGILTEGSVLNEHGFKRRRDWRITDPALAAQAQARIFRRVVPELAHAFQFQATKLERLIIARYSAEEKGKFGPHRDNTLAETAHRRFAVSIALNADFTGGGLRFPEYSPRPVQPDHGAALVFSCSLLHEVTQVTEGARYACLPFVYDDAAALQRRAQSNAAARHSGTEAGTA